MNGYLKANGNISKEEAVRCREYWEECMRTGKTPILNNMEFVPLPKEENQYPSIVRCGYCGQWAAVQTKCKSCGASIL